MIYILIFLITVLFLSKMIVFLGLFQQNGYKTKKYFKNLKKHYLKTIATYLEYLAVLLLIINIDKIWYKGIIILLIFVTIILNKSLILYPKITKRLIRLIVTFMIINLLLYILWNNHILCYLIECLLIPLILVIANFINKPFEVLIGKYYIKHAKKKLSKINPLIIGITGSFGKTSTKNILNTLINNKYYTYSTPKSYNTPMGICKSINDMNYEIEVFITELGATSPKDISKLVNFVPINIGVVTDIGPQHLESFKTIDNVLKTKLELLESKKITHLIINNDNKYLRDYIYPSNINIIKIGINNEADLVAKNILLATTGLNFDIYYQDKYMLNVETNLLGKHNIYNLLLAIAVAIILKIDVKTIVQNIKKIQPVDNRLSITNIGNIQILNDAFNSNIIGFKNAIEILKLSKNKKILITPGIVDLGKKQEEINLEISKELITGIDYIYLIDNLASRTIKEYFLINHIANYEVVSSFKEAFEQAINKYQTSTILIENDLPDNYLRR